MSNHFVQKHPCSVVYFGSVGPVYGSALRGSDFKVAGFLIYRNGRYLLVVSGIYGGKEKKMKTTVSGMIQLSSFVVFRFRFPSDSPYFHGHDKVVWCA